MEGRLFSKYGDLLELLGFIMTVAHTLSSDIDRKFTLFIDLSPFPKLMYYIEMIIIFEVLNLLCLVGIGLAVF